MIGRRTIIRMPTTTTLTHSKTKRQITKHSTTKVSIISGVIFSHYPFPVSVGCNVDHNIQSDGSIRPAVSLTFSEKKA
jgi:hypothetical protein